jgi:transposase
MEPFCLGKPSDPGRTGSDGRLFLEAILWIVHTGSPWRDLPPAFGKWNTVFKRFRDWVKADVFKRIEPPRVCRRPQLLRGWGHGNDQEAVEQIFT